MSVLAAVVLVLGALGVVPWFWRSTPPDLAPSQDGSGNAGHQGRCTRWLETAPLRPPPRPGTDAAADPMRQAGPAGRVLEAIVRQHSLPSGTTDQETRTRLQAEHAAGVAGPFLQARMGAADRAAARTHYRGPPRLFVPWYWIVYRIRRGPRGVHLESLAQALQETRRR